MTNPYLPYPVLIDDIIQENEVRDLKTFKLVFRREEDRRAFAYLPGQFAELSVFGRGEAPFGIASSPTEAGHLLFTVKRAGTVTTALHEAETGAGLGVRGPLGKSFPWQRLEGRNILVVSGGFAFTTLRSSLVYMLDAANRGRFESIQVLYGVREPAEFLYKQLLAQWQESKDLDLTLTVDRKPETPWQGRVGLVPNVLKELAPPAANTLALVCGPPVMIRYTLPVLLQLGFPREDIFLSLENRMKCGIGKCGRCNIGPKYVCLDGPVFTASELDGLPAEY
jgi:sulfhydrogenase subunit gamma (sulfur reductase)